MAKSFAQLGRSNQAQTSCSLRHVHPRYEAAELFRTEEGAKTTTQQHRYLHDIFESVILKLECILSASFIETIPLRDYFTVSPSFIIPSRQASKIATDPEVQIIQLHVQVTGGTSREQLPSVALHATRSHLCGRCVHGALVKAMSASSSTFLEHSGTTEKSETGGMI